MAGYGINIIPDHSSKSTALGSHQSLGGDVFNFGTTTGKGGLNIDSQTLLYLTIAAVGVGVLLAKMK